MADKLATLRRLRKLQADLARAELGAALHAEAAADEALAAARQAPVLEGGRAAGDLDALAGKLNPLTAAFTSWLPAAAAAIVRRGQDAEVAASMRVQAGEEAAACKGALEAVEALMTARQEAARQRALRKLQFEMDSLGTRARRNAHSK